MGFGEKQVMMLATACTKSRALLSIHLTGNEVYEPDVRRKIRRIFRPRRRLKLFEETILDPDSDIGEGTYNINKPYQQSKL